MTLRDGRIAPVVVETTNAEERTLMNRRLKRSAIRLIALGLVCLPGLAAFAAVPAAAAEPAATRGNISFMIWGDPTEKAAYDTLVAAFSAANPDIKTELVYIPNQAMYHQRLTIDFAGGTPADVFLLNYRRYAHFAASGQIEPLDAYVTHSRLVDLGDFYPEALAPYYWQKKLMAIPQNISSLVVYYNKTLFDKAGVPYPRPDWSWDDFVATAKALTKDTDGDGATDQYGMGTDAILFRVSPFIWQNGGDLVDNPAAPRRLTLDSPEAREALTRFVDLQLKHKVVPPQVEEKAEASISRFLRGAMGMYFDSRRIVPALRSVTGFDWDIAPLPRGKKPAGILHSDAFFMAAGSKNKPAAWAFIEFANSVAGQAILAKTGRTVPSRRSVANSPAFLDPGSKPAHARVFLEVIPYIRSVPIMEGWVDIESAASEEIERAYHGNVTLERAINLAISRGAMFFPKP